jgi:hypothetical protein
MVEQSKVSNHRGAALQVGLGSNTIHHHGPSLKLGGSGGQLGFGANTIKQLKGSNCWFAGLQVGLGSNTISHCCPSLKLGGGSGGGLGFGANTKAYMKKHKLTHANIPSK